MGELWSAVTVGRDLIDQVSWNFIFAYIQVLNHFLVNSVVTRSQQRVRLGNTSTFTPRIRVRCLSVPYVTSHSQERNTWRNISEHILATNHTSVWYAIRLSLAVPVWTTTGKHMQMPARRKILCAKCVGRASHAMLCGRMSSHMRRTTAATIATSASRLLLRCEFILQAHILDAGVISAKYVGKVSYRRTIWSATWR